MMHRILIPVTTGSGMDVNAYWNMPASRAAAPSAPVVVPPDAEWIALDPGTTTPNVQIAVEVPGVGPMLLAPGAPVPLPKRCNPLNMWNPIVAESGGTYPTAGGAAVAATLYGRASLVCGSADTLGAWLAYANRFRIANPKTAVLLRVGLPAAGGNFAYFPTTGLSAIRVSALGADAAGAPIAQPVDFSVTLAFTHSNGNGKAILAGGDPLDLPLSNVAAYPQQQLPASNLTLANGTLGFSQYADVPITFPTRAVGMYVTALAGTGVTTALITVEGAPNA